MKVTRSCSCESLVKIVHTIHCNVDAGVRSTNMSIMHSSSNVVVETNIHERSTVVGIIG